MGNPQNEELIGWTRIAITAGLAACISYPLMVYVPLPRLAQVILGAAFGPALALASISLGHVLQAHRRAPSIELAGIANALAGALVTGMIIVQLAINYSTASTAEGELNAILTGRIWDVVLGLDVAFDAFIGLATLLFGLNMTRDPRFGKLIGWAGAFLAVFLLWGANFYFFPDPPREHGFPEIGIFTGLWYLAVMIMLLRSTRTLGTSGGSAGPKRG
jgi:hypothetical protein